MPKPNIYMEISEIDITIFLYLCKLSDDDWLGDQHQKERGSKPFQRGSYHTAPGLYRVWISVIASNLLKVSKAVKTIRFTFVCSF
jgi:hypothetical protein